MFDRKTYWSNRKKGIRGQGAKATPKLLEKKNGEHMVMIGGSTQIVNRKTARLHASKMRNRQPFVGPSQPPEMTNHDRMMFRRTERERRRAAKENATKAPA